MALAEERHFGRAAARCQVAQPTLSAGIQALEALFGVPIVERGQRFEGFTPEGETVLAWARRMDADWRALQQRLAELRGGLAGRLTLGVIPSALPAVARLTAPFARRHPAVSLTIYSMTSIAIERTLHAFEIDGGITYLDNEPLSQVEAVPLYAERYVLLEPVGASDGSRTAISWAEAAERPLCLLTPNMQNRRILDTTFRQLGLAHRPMVETDSVINLLTHVAAGLWSTILPAQFVAWAGQPPGTRTLDLVEPAVEHRVGLAYVGREPQSPLVRALLQVIRQDRPFA